MIHLFVIIHAEYQLYYDIVLLFLLKRCFRSKQLFFRRKYKLINKNSLIHKNIKKFKIFITIKHI